jgi:hypothetical protein
VRGVGEGGIIPCGAAIANALARAIDPNGIGHEVDLFALPLKPEGVFRACQGRMIMGGACELLPSFLMSPGPLFDWAQWNAASVENPSKIST